MPGLGFVASKHGGIPGVNQPPPQLPPLQPAPPPAPAPVAPAPAPTQSLPPGQALLQPGGLTTRNILGTLSQVLQNLGAVAQGQPIPFSAEKIREGQLAEDRHRLGVLEVQSKIIQNALKMRGPARKAYLDSVLAQLPGGIGQGVTSLLEESSATDEEQLKRQIDGFIDLNEEARLDLMNIVSTEELDAYEAYHKYGKELDRKSALVSARKLAGLRDKFGSLIGQTSNKEAVMAELGASPPSVEEVDEFFPGYLTEADRAAIKNYPQHFPFIKSPDRAKEERAGKLWMEQEEVRQGNRKELAEHYDILPEEQAQAEGLTGDSPVYQRSSKTGRTTKIGGKKGGGAEEKRAQDIQTRAKKLIEEGWTPQDAADLATAEQEELTQALSPGGREKASQGRALSIYESAKKRFIEDIAQGTMTKEQSNARLRKLAEELGITLK